MKLTTIFIGQSVRIMRLLEPVGGIFAPDLTKTIQERYRFVTVPKSLAEFDKTKGITFGHGVFNTSGINTKNLTSRRNIVINKFQIYHNGLVAETQSYVEDAELFLDDAIEWAIQTFGVTVAKNEPILKGFLSNIEIELDSPFTKTQVKAYEHISKFLASKLGSYGQESPKFEQVGFALHTDLAKQKIPAATNFKLERREGSPHSSNLYFSTAPLKTQDHLDLL